MTPLMIIITVVCLLDMALTVVICFSKDENNMM
jgi:hypothetical protein